MSILDKLYEMHTEITGVNALSKSRFKDTLPEGFLQQVKSICSVGRKRECIDNEFVEIYNEHKKKHGDNARAYSTMRYRYTIGWSREKLINEN